MTKDSAYEQHLRTLYTGLNLDRLPEDRIVENFYAAISAAERTSTYLPHSDLIYCRAALEAKFPDRLFSLQEVKDLIQDVYGVKYT